MKVIIISDADARALLDQIKLEALGDGGLLLNGFPDYEHATVQKVFKHVQSDVHRCFHYVVTRWLQEMGADTLRH